MSVISRIAASKDDETACLRASDALKFVEAQEVRDALQVYLDKRKKPAPRKKAK